jgi:hypothetical protein
MSNIWQESNPVPFQWNEQTAKNSLVVRSTDDFGQSVAVPNLMRDGLINPIKRELRYVIESSVKNLYVDQHAEEGTPLSQLSDRLDFMKAKVGSSIDVFDELNLRAIYHRMRSSLSPKSMMPIERHVPRCTCHDTRSRSV